MDGEPIILKDEEYYLEHPDELDDVLDRVMEYEKLQYQASIRRLIEGTQKFLDYLNQLVEEE